MKLVTKDLTAVILAGGQGRRMGGQDKGLIEFNGRPLVEILIEKLKQQSIDIVINANRNQSRYAQFGLPVISDQLTDFQGPLAGFAAVMQALPNTTILTLPCDSPRLASDYVNRFLDCFAQTQAPIIVAHDGKRLQPVHAMMRTDLLSSLIEFLQRGERKIDRWYAEHHFEQVDFSDATEMFENINTPEDHRRLEQDA